MSFSRRRLSIETARGAIAITRRCKRRLRSTRSTTTGASAGVRVLRSMVRVVVGAMPMFGDGETHLGSLRPHQREADSPRIANIDGAHWGRGRVKKRPSNRARPKARDQSKVRAPAPVDANPPPVRSFCRRSRSTFDGACRRRCCAMGAQTTATTVALDRVSASVSGVSVGLRHRRSAFGIGIGVDVGVGVRHRRR